METGTLNLYNPALKTTNYGELLQKIVRKDGFATNIIENYNNEIDRLKAVIMSITIDTREGIVSFSNVRFLQPTIEIGGSIVPMTPMMARERINPYCSKIICDITYTMKPIAEDVYGNPIANSSYKEPEIRTDIAIGYIPVMLGSKLCLLHNKTPAERMEMGECFNDFFGYFFISSERIIINQEKLRFSTFLIWEQEGQVVGNVTCPTIQGTTLTKIMVTKNRSLIVYLSHLSKKKSTMPPFPPIFAIYKLFDKDMDEAMGEIMSFIDEEHHNAVRFQLEPSMADYYALMDGADDKETLINRLLDIRKTVESRVTIDRIVPDITRDLFPHITDVRDKLEHLTIYTAKMLEYMIGIRKLDDRDSYANKKIETAGTKITQLFKAIWYENIQEISEKIKDAKSLREIENNFNASNIKTSMISAFGPNAWGTKKMRKKENITESLKRDTPVAIFAQIQKINVSASRRSTTPKLRMPHGSGVGYIDPFDTPEGEGTGLVRNFSCSCYISLEKDADVMMQYCKTDKNIKKYVYNKRYMGTVPLMVNGIIKFWCIPQETTRLLKKFKNENPYYKDSCVFYNKRDKCVEFSCDGGRPVRPLLTVNDNCELIIDIKKMWNADIDDLVHSQCIEYVDAREQEWCYLAETVDYVRQRKAWLDELDASKDEYMILELRSKLSETIPYQYCEIDPSSMFSISSYLIPQANRQAGPRTAYQCVEENTLVTLADGSQKPIKDIQETDEVITINPKTHAIEYSKIHSKFVIDSKIKGDAVYKLTTFSGREITATGDHPFLTMEGWKDLEKLNPETDQLALFPAPVPLSREVDEFICLTEDEFVAKMRSLNVKETLIIKFKNELKEKNLLPLMSNDKRIDSLARIYGHAITDGSINVYNNAPRLNASMESVDDIIDYENDSYVLGFTRYKPSTSIDPDGSVSGSTSKPGALAALVLSLSVTIGVKQKTNSHKLPSFILKGSLHTKREFLAAYQGGDGCRIRWNKNQRSYNYVMASTLQTKEHDYLDSLYEQMMEIKSIYDELGIKAIVIKTPNKNATQGICEIKLSDDMEEHIKYMNTVGFRYCKDKNLISTQTVEYLKYKSIFRKEYMELKQKVLELYNGGTKKCDIKRLLKLKDTVVDNFIRHPHSVPVSPFDFIKIDEWCETKCIISNNVVFSPIKSIEKVEHCKIADFTTYSDNHSFIANGFVTHNCGMFKQALSQYHSNEHLRFDASYKMLHYPKKALFQTDMQDTAGLNLMSNGLTAHVAIMAHPDNPEDCIIIKEEAVKYANLFDMAKKITYSCKLLKKVNFVEQLKMPPINVGEKEGKYQAIDENGIPRLDAYVRPGDCILGKVRIYKKNTPLIQASSIVNISDFVSVGEDGYIDRVLITKNIPDDVDIVKVKIRQPRKYQAGDKMAMRYSQKGTVARLIPARELPMVASGPLKGMVPDLIVNPHSQPSRMTINNIIEILVSKASAITGEFVNATTYRDFSDEMEKAQQVLEDYGLDSSGKEEFIHSNGVKMVVKSFFGPVHYQALRHHVVDKIQMRARKGVKPSTRQPIQGRSNEGGLKVGEMERDALISHGASALLRERLCDVSDAYNLPVCKCGVIAITNYEQNIYKCTACGPNAKIGVIRIPYVVKYLMHLLNGAGIHMKFNVSEVVTDDGRPEEKFLV